MQIRPHEALTINRILKVNHAGEHGAIRIYQAQIAVARRLHPELVAPLSGMLAHEIDHCKAFREAMPARQAHPCHIMALWGVGGLMLGFCTALAGRQAIWITTAAVEAAVHRHLDDQLHFLTGRDDELYAIIAAIREEELSHSNTAEASILGRNWYGSALRRAITAATDALIWLSTWGDSTSMARELASSRMGDR